MTEAMPFLQKAILLSYAPRSLAAEGFFGISFIQKQIFQAIHVQIPEALFIGIGQQVAQAIQNSVVPDFFPVQHGVSAPFPFFGLSFGLTV